MVIRIALAGNPNSGKTTMFNKFTGSSQRVGNWPGVTVERKEGKLKQKEDTVIVDLPGIYSLSPYSPEEIVSRDFLLNDRPDAVINIVDAMNLERNLYLTTQILEVGIPTVLALNMMDVAEREGTKIDVEKLSKLLGCKVVKTSAINGEGLNELVETVMSVIGTDSTVRTRYSKKMEEHISKMEEVLNGKVPDEQLRWSALKLLERDSRLMASIDQGILDQVEATVAAMEKDMDNDADGIIAEERYNLIGSIVSDAVDKGGKEKKETRSDKLDKIVTNRWLGLPIFLLVMFGIYFIAIQTLGVYGTDWLNGLFEEVIVPGATEWLDANVGIDWMTGLIADGIIAGVGAVLGFLPQMLILFILLVILEECGYMARVAFVMDRIFRHFGLSGKSFIPMLVGMGCSVPGIMASKAIEGESERRITAMTVSFVPCSAKLPVVALIAGALFSNSALIAVSIYFLGIVCVLLSGIILKKWKSLSGIPAPFIMELPPYHWPNMFSTFKSTLDRGWSFVKKAGTFILLAAALIWFLSSFDWSMNMLDAEDISSSILASLGRAVTGIFVPLGFGAEWEYTVATITGLLAKETVVSTFEILFNDVDGALEGLGAMAGYSFLVFNMVCAPCFAAIGAMRGELGTWKDTGKAVLYQTALAYALALIVYQFGIAIFDGEVQGWIVLAIIALAALIYILVAKDPFGSLNRKVKSNG